jgi:hypothetical protein
MTTTRQYKFLQPYNRTKYDVRRDLVPPYSYCIVQLLVQGTTWWWPSYKAETYSCILHIVVYYTVILSDILLCFDCPYMTVYTPVMLYITQWYYLTIFFFCVLTARIWQYIHILCCINLTQRRWHTLRFTFTFTLYVSQLTSRTGRFLQKQALALPFRHIGCLTVVDFLLSFDIFFCVSLVRRQGLGRYSEHCKNEPYLSLTAVKWC